MLESAEEQQALLIKLIQKHKSLEHQLFIVSFTWFLKIYFYYIYLVVGCMRTHSRAHASGGQGSLFFPSMWGSQGSKQVVGLGSKYLYPLSYLTGPIISETGSC